MPPKRAAATRASKATKKVQEEEEKNSDEEVKQQEEGEEKEEEVEKPTKKSKRVNDKETEKAAIAKEEQKHGLNWTEHDTLYVLDSPQIKHSSKIIGFDMDSTLVYPKSGAKFPKNRNDWVWLYESVPKKLKEMHEKGFNVVIFTNQAGIEKKKQSPADIKGKIIDLSNELGFPIQAFVAAATDHNRKPNKTMWNVFKSKHNGGVEIDHKVSLYVGDAAGRKKGWKPTANKDFSCGDRTFAHNCGLPFQTPEEFFLNESPISEFEWDGIDPNTILKAYEGKSKPTEEEIIGNVKHQELVVMVGRPASGKSTFSKKYFVPKGYVHINQDTIGTKAKCVKACKEAIKAGKSVVIDNTNATSDTRGEYMIFAKEAGIPSRCFWLDTEPDIAHHLNFYREKQTNGAVRRIPDVGYNMFKSKFKDPSTSEGFTEVKKISWFPEFTDNEKELFLERTG